MGEQTQGQRHSASGGGAHGEGWGGSWEGFGGCGHLGAGGEKQRRKLYGQLASRVPQRRKRQGMQMTTFRRVIADEGPSFHDSRPPPTLEGPPLFSPWSHTGTSTFPITWCSNGGPVLPCWAHFRSSAQDSPSSLQMPRGPKAVLTRDGSPQQCYTLALTCLTCL